MEMKQRHHWFRLVVFTVMALALVFTAGADYAAAASSKGTKANKMVALTFDDGPDKKYTDKVLDILKEHKVKGTFFVVGDRVKQYPDVMKRIVQEGHALGNHSWSHSELTKLSKEKARQEIVKTDNAIREITGAAPTMMRPPYGATSARVKGEIKALGHAEALWNIDTRDWAADSSVADILKAVKSNSSNKITVLMHSGGGKRDKTVKALPQIIDYYRSKGYTFVTMAELNGLPDNLGGSKASSGSTDAADAAKSQALQDTGKIATVTVDSLNIRNGGGLQYEVIAKIPEGSQVTLLANEGDWFHVKLPDGRTGWASAGYLSVKSDASGDTPQLDEANSATQRNIRLIYNGSEVNFPDAKPYMDANSRIQVPVRFMAESLSFYVKWEGSGTQKTLILSKGDVNVELKIGDNSAVVNGMPISMDTSAMLLQGRTYVPLRFLSELAGMDITWSSADDTVTLSYKKPVEDIAKPPEDIAKPPEDTAKPAEDYTAPLEGNAAPPEDNAEDWTTSGDTYILSAPRATVEQAKAWARAKGATDVFIDLADIVWEEALEAGVDPVVVYCQAAKETGFGKFGGLLDETFNNPAGLKTQVGGSDTDHLAHQRFFSWQEGVQAQIDHLALYAGAPGYPKAYTPDPRHFPGLLGQVVTVEALGGSWATSPTYGIEIVGMMTELETTASNF
ncbi:polysaccharide deacetylase family protein [Paenibacillus macerans]|uniref:polysaccharide deacetylase family protein n=1 Tax=Paenibacillus macerans TaxID=44252 RepID=UPI001F119256|nr:polysaccharide deacetylase family protein [Paenibacillus macerans]UMV45097.1 polysaccharide deacetylase family protein [Paenibacillus macerans]